MQQNANFAVNFCTDGELAGAPGFAPGTECLLKALRLLSGNITEPAIRLLGIGPNDLSQIDFSLNPSFVNLPPSPTSPERRCPTPPLRHCAFPSADDSNLTGQRGGERPVSTGSARGYMPSLTPRPGLYRENSAVIQDAQDPISRLTDATSLMSIRTLDSNSTFDPAVRSISVAHGDSDGARSFLAGDASGAYSRNRGSNTRDTKCKRHVHTRNDSCVRSKNNERTSRPTQTTSANGDNARKVREVEGCASNHATRHPGYPSNVSAGSDTKVKSRTQRPKIPSKRVDKKSKVRPDSPRRT